MSDTKTPGYNADQKAGEREREPYVIGQRTFTPVRKTTKIMRQIRRLSREQQIANREVERAEKAENYDRADEQSDVATAKTLDMLSVLLRDEEGNAPDVGFLAEQLDVEDAGGIVNSLVGEAEADPTTATPTTSSS